MTDLNTFLARRGNATYFGSVLVTGLQPGPGAELTKVDAPHHRSPLLHFPPVPCAQGSPRPLPRPRDSPVSQNGADTTTALAASQGTAKGSELLAHSWVLG